jgi:hypothetical protein
MEQIDKASTLEEYRLAFREHDLRKAHEVQSWLGGSPTIMVRRVSLPFPQMSMHRWHVLVQHIPDNQCKFNGSDKPEKRYALLMVIISQLDSNTITRVTCGPRGVFFSAYRFKLRSRRFHEAC